VKRSSNKLSEEHAEPVRERKNKAVSTWENIQNYQKYQKYYLFNFIMNIEPQKFGKMRVINQKKNNTNN